MSDIKVILVEWHFVHATNVEGGVFVAASTGTGTRQLEKVAKSARARLSAIRLKETVSMMGARPAKVCVLALLLIAVALAGPTACTESNVAPPTAVLSPVPPSTAVPSPMAPPTAVPSPDESANRQARKFRYIAVGVSGLGNTCALRTDGIVICWGQGNLVPPAAGHYTMISVGQSHACGVKTDGQLECWGENGFGQGDAPDGEFLSVSAGYTHTCGVRLDGVVECWGGDESTSAANDPESALRALLLPCAAKVCPNTAAPAGTFLSVSAGNGSTCGIRPDGSVECWGQYDVHESPPASVKFQSIDAGLAHVCGVLTHGTVTCWGSDTDGQSSPPDGVFRSVSAGENYSCGVRPDASIDCWGFNGFDKATPPADTFMAVSAGDSHTCGLRVDGTLRCWGEDQESATPPGSMWQMYTCETGADTTLECRRGDSRGDIAPPDNKFTRVSVSNSGICSLLSTGSVVCTQDDSESPTVGLPGHDFVGVSGAGHYVCGLRSQGEVWCDYDDDDVESAALVSGSFRALSVGKIYACALQADGAAKCWGHSSDISAFVADVRPVDPPPDASFASISVGRWHACGVRTDSSIECWGDNYTYEEYCIPDSYGMPTCGFARRGDYTGQGGPPSGEFRAVSPGGAHTCAIRADRTAECWGDDRSGQATPPSGAFTEVSAGRRHSCGLRPGGAVECWGSSGNAYSPEAVAASGCLTPPTSAAECRTSYYRDPQHPPPPEGEFTAISTGWDFTCGVRVDGALICWGDFPVYGEVR